MNVDPRDRAARGAAAVIVLGALIAGCPDTNPSDVPDATIEAGDAHDATVDGGCPVSGRDGDEGFGLEIGTGTEGMLADYRPLRAGDPLWVVPGPQGLQHLRVAFRGRGIDPTLVELTAITVRADDCGEVSYVRTRLRWVAIDGMPGLFGLPTLPLTLVDDNDRFEYCTTLGREVILVVDVDDARGHRAHRELRVRVEGIDPGARPEQREAWLAACASRIDGGTDARPSD